MRACFGFATSFVPWSPRCSDHVVIGLDASVTIAADCGVYLSGEACAMTFGFPSIQNGSDQHAGGIDRQGPDVFVKQFPGVVILKKILFDVGRVEDTDCASMLINILGDRPNRFWTGEIPDERHNQIRSLHASDILELLLRTEKTPVSRCTIAFRHQIGVGRRPAELVIAGARVPKVGTGFAKRLRDITKSSLVGVREPETFFAFQILDNL